MRLAVVDSRLCTGDSDCPARQECPPRALFQLDPGETFMVDAAVCNGCGDCVPACPAGAITIKEV